jgi:hypothetical protein
LGDLVGLTLWELTPQSDVELANLKDGAPVDLADTPDRAETRALAQRLHDAGAKGLAYRLHRDHTKVGYALFGPAGVGTPSGVGLGTWSSAKSLAAADKSLAKFLVKRAKAAPSSVTLRWLPEDAPLG